MFEWHEKLAKRVSKTNLELLIFGKAIGIFWLGYIFSLSLLTYSYAILIGAFFLFFFYLSNMFHVYFSKKKVSYLHHIFGGIGLFLLSLYLGINSAHLPLEWYPIGLGIALTIPAIIDLLRGKS
jgi:hypothetical protein